MVVNFVNLGIVKDMDFKDFPGVAFIGKMYNTIELGREWDVALGRLAGIIVNSDCRRYLQSRFLKSGGGSPTARKVISRNIIKRNFETMVLGDYWVDFDRFGCSGKLKCNYFGFWHCTSFIVAICVGTAKKPEAQPDPIPWGSVSEF